MNRIKEDSWCIKDIVEMYVPPTPENPGGSGDISLPESQRQWAWKNKRGQLKMEKLIDSVMNRYAIPTCILNRIGLAKFHIYDGRHRIETFYLYAHDQFNWNGKKYSELTKEEQRQFDSREIPVTIVSNATPEILAEMFIRLNQGSPLKDYDLFWANRSTKLIKAVYEMIINNERLSTCLGNQDMNKREDLANWVAIMNGLATQHAGNMTTSYIRVCSQEGGLNIDIDEARVKTDLDALCTLLELANEKYPAMDKEKQQLKKVGKIIAYFFADWMQSRNESVINKWVDIIGRLRGPDKDEMNYALTTSGAQNLTFKKVETVLAKVNDYLTQNIVANQETESDDDSQ